MCKDQTQDIEYRPIRNSFRRLIHKFMILCPYRQRFYEVVLKYQGNVQKLAFNDTMSTFRFMQNRLWTFLTYN